MRVGSLRAHLDHAELVGQGDRLPDGGDRDAGAGGDVRLDHLAEVHPVDVVGADHDDDVRLLVPQQVQALQDGVRRAGEPALAEALLRRHGRDVGVGQCRQAPGLRHVPVEAVRLVLGEHDDLAQAGVDQVRQGEVDQAVVPGERDSRLRAVGGEGHESLAFAAGQYDAEDLLGRHASTVEASSALY